MASTGFLQQPQRLSKEATTSNPEGPAGAHRVSTDGDLECLVCREPYSSARPPKLLGCQHAFCAVCLKLLLCVQDDTWSVTCPLCRQATAVPGGLVCTLRDQEAMLGRLAQPGPEVRLCPQGLANRATLAAGHPSLARDYELDMASANSVAARRLAAHLLLLVLLMALILPFIYPGVIRWVLSFLIALALLLSLIFCCHPNSQGGCCWPSPRTLFCREQKHSEIASIA
uniref:RING-type E3 ubiquitin transferase n=1 Tax=Catagonus wagneri TaxID=51154 RepID=A0A8C3YFR7_9CETA